MSYRFWAARCRFVDDATLPDARDQRNANRNLRMFVQVEKPVGTLDEDAEETAKFVDKVRGRFDVPRLHVAPNFNCCSWCVSSSVTSSWFLSRSCAKSQKPNPRWQMRTSSEHWEHLC